MARRLSLVDRLGVTTLRGGAAPRPPQATPAEVRLVAGDAGGRPSIDRPALAGDVVFSDTGVADDDGMAAAAQNTRLPFASGPPGHARPQTCGRPCRRFSAPERRVPQETKSRKKPPPTRPTLLSPAGPLHGDVFPGLRATASNKRLSMGGYFSLTT